MEGDRYFYTEVISKMFVALTRKINIRHLFAAETFFRVALKDRILSNKIPRDYVRSLQILHMDIIVEGNDIYSSSINTNVVFIFFF